MRSTRASLPGAGSGDAPQRPTGRDAYLLGWLLGAGEESLRANRTAVDATPKEAAAFPEASRSRVARTSATSFSTRSSRHSSGRMDVSTCEHKVR